MLVTRTKTFVTTRAELLDEYINKWIDGCGDDISSFKLTPISISYTSINGKGAYMIAQQIQYWVHVPDDPE